MSFWDDVKTVGSLGMTNLGLGWTGLIPEDMRSKIPVVNSLSGARSDEEKKLLAKQEQMAADMKRRQAINERARMNALGQKMLAFNPQNQLMAQMFGPEAAFTPEQFAQMAADPYARSEDAILQEANPIDPKTGARKYRGEIPMSDQERADLQRARENEARQARVQQQMTPLGPGPAPLRLPPPQRARRY